MNAVKSPATAIRVAMLSSVSLFALMLPAVGATITVNAPEPNGVELDATVDALINNSDISNPNGPAVSSDNSPVDFILNNAGASITGSNGNSAVWINNTIETFTNNGTIETDSNEAVGADGLITTFINTGSITSTDTDGVNGQGGFGSFSNNGGTITGDDNGVRTGADATTFSNSGTITGQNNNGVAFNNGSGVGTFTNSGTITGAQNGVKTDGGADSFTNSGTIIGQSDNGVGFYDNNGVGTFNNSGTITGFNNGVTTSNGAISFTNSGTITGQNGSGVGFFDNVGAGAVVNSGTIEGLDGNGVDADGDVTSFSNLAGGVISGENGTDNAGGVNINGTIGTFSNAGTITGEGNGVNINDNVLTSFSNSGTVTGGLNVVGDAAGVGFSGTVASFSNTGSITGDGSAVNFNNAVTSFSNSGTLTGGQYQAVRFAQGVTSFFNAGNIFAQPGQSAVTVDNGVAGTIFNSGTLSGGSQGFYFDNGATSFTNSSTGNISGLNAALDSNAGIGSFQNAGTMSSTNNTAVNIRGAVTTFGNSGSISSANNRGVAIDGTVGTFTNSGSIISLGNGVDISGDVASFNNSGTIRATDTNGPFGVRLDGAGVITNSGTIEGPRGISFENPAAATVINSGTIRGTFSEAIYFNDGDGLLKILTGSQIFGEVEFGNGANDTFDFSNFYGTTVLSVPGLENVVAGDRAYAFIAADTIAIFDPTGATALDTVHASTVGAIRNLLDQQIANIGGDDVDGDLLINGYMAERPQTDAEAATAVMSDLSVDQPDSGMTVWASAFGGVARDSAPVDLSTTYGGLVAGTHAALDTDHTLGGLAAYSRSSFSVANGQQTITSDTGILGVYGKSDLGVVTVDYSLLGGASSHASTRQIVALGVLQTATASFSSWFLSPEVGVEMPLLSTEDGELNVKASASYIGGSIASYTETAAGGNVTVGSVGIGVWQGELELNGKRVLSSNEHGDVELHGRVGLFAQANAGNSNIPINMLGTTINYTDPGTTAYGAFAGASISAPLTDAVSLNVGANGSVRSDGMVEASANLGIAGSF